MTQIAKVAVAAATYAIDKPYDYLVPSGMELSVGCRVTVPFGRGNRTAEGMVLQLRQEVPAKPLKAIRSLLDQEPVLSEKEIRLALWMRQRYFCTCLLYTSGYRLSGYTGLCRPGAVRRYGTDRCPDRYLRSGGHALLFGDRL